MALDISLVERDAAYLTGLISKSDPPAMTTPPRLSVRQHVLPNKSIERFLDPLDNCVEIELFSHALKFRTGLGDANFVAKRVWTQHVEDGARPTEIAFQVAADEFSASRVLTIEHMRIANRFYALLVGRSIARHVPVPPSAPVMEIEDRPPLSNSDAKFYESQGIFLRPSGDGADRLVKDIFIARALQAAEGRTDNWGLLISEKREFLVSDDFSRTVLIPVSPTLYLVRGFDTTTLTDKDVIGLNEVIRQSARNFCFARHLDRC